MSFLKPVDCPKCGAPLPSDSIGASVTTCAYCDGTLALDPNTVFAARYERAFAASDIEADLRVAGVPYALDGLLGRGAASEVHAARRTRAPGERVVLKLGDAPFDREIAALSALYESRAPGYAHFRTRLPQLVASGLAEPNGKHAIVYRHLSGFTHTAEDVRRQLGSGLDPRHTAWMLRRLLELLAWVHASGFVHGAIAPEHVLINARDHGAMLLGWSRAERSTSRVAAGEDVAAAARSLSWRPLPSALSAVVGRLALVGGVAADAERDVTAAALKDFGTPRFVPLLLG